MAAGQHATEFTVVQLDKACGPPCSSEILLGLARPGIDVEVLGPWKRDDSWWLSSIHGGLSHRGKTTYTHAPGSPPKVGRWVYTTGDVIALLLDCDAGTLSVKKNGQVLGVVVAGLAGQFCWAASSNLKHNAVRIGAAHPEAFGDDWKRLETIAAARTERASAE
jgi:hypothetical protein